ncbi:hypothetical protein F8M41_012256 [Gigaspora margarita]|uniref:F-box domain-containing protein n=1 Tax=Gigaspora margarita TaxID=4874 RepID=A0A8H4B3X6_GIGMA|nr:hypothetical protein F8M41_012256 [Gigaspora margarita]
MPSKLFMGDMPELIENILNHLNDKYYSLFSCALVNQHWYKMSIPIFWQNPFLFDSNLLFISEYFSSLDENDKFILKECGINAKFPNTLFNYARFLKVLDLSSLENLSLGPISDFSTENATALLKILAKNTTKISALKLGEFYSDYEPHLFHAIICFIKSQEQLR